MSLIKPGPDKYGNTCLLRYDSLWNNHGLEIRSAKMKTLHVYNGIYYAWEINPPVPPNAGSGIQSF